MKAHSANASALALWLSNHPKVSKVFFAGLPDHPGHSLAKKQQSDFGAVVSFVVDGGQNAAWQVIDATQMLSLTANLGDAKTTIVHPATTTHGRLSAESLAEAGIEEGRKTISVCLVYLDDIKNYLELGLQL